MVEERAKEAVEHLQHAVVEVIEAVRAALDVIEDVVSDPHLLTAVANEAGKLVETIAHGIVETANTVAEGTTGQGRRDPPANEVQRIRVS